MGADETVEIEVVYAAPDEQVAIRLRVAPGMTAREAVVLSGIARRFSAIDPAQAELGIYGRRVSDETVLAAGDRLEIYRPLVADPKQARRRRAHKPA
jgi:hypothetical protein